MELDKNIKQELAELIANPEKVTSQHTAMLSELLEEYPYYQPLHLLLAKAGQQSEEKTHLATAALYTNGQALHRFLFEQHSGTQNQQEPTVPAMVEPVDKENVEVQKTPVADEQETFEEITEELPVVEPEVADTVTEEPENLIEKEEVPEEEVFEEIAEVDYNNYRPFRNSDTADEVVKEPQEAEHIERKNSLEDNFVFESIVSSDFFAFENSFGTDTTEEKVEVGPAPVIEEHDEKAAAEVENGRVSNYHDDKLPYTFLWWLAKTRKEHESNLQPYIVPKKGNSQELQQQYVEHIFHMQSHLTGNESLLDNNDQEKPVNKDFEIIESFIRNDPQITPPNAEQIDNENKAKKSAEDQNDLVSETLANIYIEQMLYDKAIDTYEKLSLKFPEKSRYFADLIQSIEKKI